MLTKGRKDVCHATSCASLLLIGCLFIGCAGTASTPEERAAQRETAEQRQIAEHEADEQRHAENERRHAEDDLRHEFARYSTAELKLMDMRYKELRQSSGGARLSVWRRSSGGRLTFPA